MQKLPVKDTKLRDPQPLCLDGASTARPLINVKDGVNFVAHPFFRIQNMCLGYWEFLIWTVFSCPGQLNN